ncbi:MAG: asparagine--tRNA ligase [Haloplasmataceae bacterium]|nr:asparagine--tRNA ligase [Haloplasmataceae bacterium]
MKKVVIRQIYRDFKNYENQVLEITGWARSNRAQKQFGFLMINDGSFFESIQVVYEENLENFKEIQKYRVGSALKIIGTVNLTPNAKQPFEIKAQEVILVGDCPEDYPIQPKRHTREFLREVAHLRPRTNLFSAVFRVRSLTAHAIHTFFQDRGFVYVHAPIITASDAEGAGEMFRVTTLDLHNVPKNEEKNIDYKQDFFGKSTNLTVSGQLEAEVFALAFRDVYTFGPTFRAELSNTYKHAAEFWMIEPEIAFADLLDDMNLAEDMVKFIIQYVIEKAPEEMQFFDEFVQKGLLNRLNTLLKSKFHRCDYSEAIEILKKAPKQFENKVEWGIDLASEHERYLTDEYFKAPVFVINYPKEIKAINWWIST